jgi:nucleotide-binding universal stress UspA family protein
MITIKKILCPVDFFAASDAAVRYAAGLASNYGAKLHLLHVVVPLVPSSYDFPTNTVDMTKAMEGCALLELKKLEMSVRQTGVSAQIEVRFGDVYHEINRAIEKVKPELIVMGTHGGRGAERWFMGSTTEKLLRHSPVPLVTVNETGEKPVVPRQFRRILVTTDFAEGTSDALSYAFSVAEENESRITLLHVLHDVAADLSGNYRDALIQGIQKELDDLVPREARTWCDVVSRVETGIPYQIILRTIEDEKIDLLVMNIHGKGMLDRILLGSNAGRIVRASSCPVMLIPPLKRKSRRRVRPGARAAA